MGKSQTKTVKKCWTLIAWNDDRVIVHKLVNKDEEDADFALDNMRAELDLTDDDVTWHRLEDARKLEVWG